MKTILKLSLVFALFTGVSINAFNGDGNENEDFRLHVMKKDGTVVAFSLNKVKEAKLSVYEKDGTLIYSENAKGTDEGILRTFNLKEFPSGSYLLTVETDDKKLVYEITVTEYTASLSRDAISEVYKSKSIPKNTSVASRE